jgi:DHA2 family multidrug resistance protein
VLDATIANVALPHMQGSLSASTDQISWVLTSYLIASAIVMPAIGWLSSRFGRRRIALISVAGFTFGSMLCGTAQTIEQMVVYRLIQGVFGAGLVPLSQAVILDIYTPSERGGAMTLWTAGIMVGPIVGPTLGAWLTDTYSWHWVFYVNVPVGALAFAGTWLYLPAMPLDRTRKFDWTGFLSLALGIGCLQLVLDRGETKDWFDSLEIACEATLCATGFYLFIVQTMAAEHPFVSRQLLRDRNFVSSMTMAFTLGLALNSTSALLPPYFQGLGGYPVLLSGLIMAPRGIGTLMGSLVISRLLNVADPRHLIACGLVMLGGSSWQMAHWTPDVPFLMQVPMMMIQGAAMTTVFTPMQIVAFSNVPPSLRTEASGLISLVRNFGGSIGVAMLETLLARNTQVTHQDLARFATPFNRALQSGAAAKYWDLKTASGLTHLDAVVNYHAQVVAYSDDFFAICLMVIPGFAAMLLMRRPARAVADDGEVHGVLE